MQSILSNSSIKIFLVISFSVFILINCEGTTKPDPGPNAPAIPPQSTMLISFSGLIDGTNVNLSEGALSKTGNSLVGTNWQYSAFVVGFWTTITTGTMLIPVTAFGATINTTPEYIGNLRWKWTKTFTSLLVQYTAELYGQIDGDKVNWEMHISRTGGFSDFLWFTGESNVNGTGGTWIFNKSQENPVAFLQVGWTRPDLGIADLRYEIIEADSEGEGSFIYYSFNADSVFNSSCSLYNAADDINVDVEWSSIDRSGHVKSPGYFSDELWHCWDENRNNINCN